MKSICNRFGALLVVAGAMAFNGVAFGQAGAVVAWGDNQFGEYNPPASAQSGVTAIAAGLYHTIALKDGAVLAWGWNGDGQLDIPDAALSGVTAIAAGMYHTIALKDGAVLAWGYNGYGQCYIPPYALSGVTAIAGGYGHTIALKAGAVLAWGNNDFSNSINIPNAAQSGVTAIASGGVHIVALKNGAVLAWGDNTLGQCLGTDNSGTPITSYRADGTIPVKLNGVTLIGVTAIAGGSRHTIALKDGAVLAWGAGTTSQTNGGSTTIDYGQSIIPNAAKSGVTAIAGGYGHTIALKDGAVLAWGNNDSGQCTIPASANSGVSAIAAGHRHTIALKTDPNDIDGDGIPNATDNCQSVANPTQADCDGNGVGDACELDCNHNGLADVCEIGNGTTSDCNNNHIPDSCDFISGVLQDCNHNGIADVCEILSGAVTDQNLNGVPDTCEVATVTRVQPISGPSTGGTAVRITGTNFFGALPVSVTFSGAPATDVVVVSLTEITAVTPSGSPGDAFVAVNGAGAEEFYYRPSCDGDLDNNGTIDSSDLGLLLINMGDCSSSLTTAQEQEPLIFQITETPTPVLNKK